MPPRVDVDIYQQFAYELLETRPHQQNNIKVNYSAHTGEWNISGKTIPSSNDVLAYTTYGTDRANAYKILEDALNLRDVRVYDTKYVDGKETRVLNKDETTKASIIYKLANGKRVCLNVSIEVKELLEQSDRQTRSQRRQDKAYSYMQGLAGEK